MSNTPWSWPRTQEDIAIAEHVGALVTVIDFCNEMALVISSHEGDGTYEPEAIRDCHDITHALAGGDRTRDWRWVTAWVTDLEGAPGLSEAWPDVQRRMAEVLDLAASKAGK